MPIRLMIVDDHQMLREGLRRSMSEIGFDVIGEASDGDEAVTRATAQRPDVILMDVTMPRMDGVEACRQVKDALPDTHIVMLTMHADQSVLADAIRAGASGYLVKDCSTDEIADAVKIAAAGQTALSPQLAATMLDEVRRMEEQERAQENRLITKREEEVLQMIADGCSTTEVAEGLYISQKTVKNHLASIYEKLDITDRAQAAVEAIRLGLQRGSDD